MNKRILILLTGIIFLWIPVKGQDGEVMKPLDVAKMSYIGGAYISPDGGHIAYLKSVQFDPLKENKSSRSELHLYDVDAGESKPFLTRNSAGNIKFRPGHQSITFLGDLEEEKKTSLYEIPLSGGEAVKIYSFETSIYNYDWGPDGKQLAFIARASANQEEKASDLPYKPVVYEEGQSFNLGYLVNIDEGEAQKIDYEAYYHNLVFSPTGDRIAVATAPTALIDDQYMKQSVRFIDVSTLKPTAAIEHEGKLADMVFNPEGDQLAFLGGADINDPHSGRLWVVATDESKPRQLEPEFEGSFDDFDWSGSKEISFIASEGVWTTYGTIKSNGSGLKKLISKRQPILLTLDVADNGAVTFTGETPEYPMELFLMKAKETEPQRLTFNNTWLDKIIFGEQEVVNYQARDGKKLEGILIRPVNEETGQRYPLITVVHGGPESHYQNGWLTYYSTVGQMGAGMKYAVFYPNYRGSTGRGEAFAKSSQGDLAGAEFDDIVDGVDYLIDQGLVDRERVGVTGGSYGGYATGWLSTKYTDRFAAGVMFVGISNNISKWGTGDIPEELYLVHARKRIWEDYQFFLERSPVYHAGEAKTPLLIMAGEEDTRVHPSQSIELYRHIKTRTDTPVRLVLYPGEGHGNRNATARLDYSLRQLRWFEKYLKQEDIEMTETVELDLVR